MFCKSRILSFAYFIFISDVIRSTSNRINVFKFNSLEVMYKGDIASDNILFVHWVQIVWFLLNKGSTKFCINGLTGRVNSHSISSCW